ncbi:MAG: hypothetical protein JRD89_03985 [Deltaproteobacteria bacterium]|nr:hypothetical protein [Deltaproteobacteria bacterium]
MWHKLHVLVNKVQYTWLRAESFTRGISIGEVIRRLIDEAREKRSQSRSDNSTPKSETDMK